MQSYLSRRSTESGDRDVRRASPRRTDFPGCVTQKESLSWANCLSVELMVDSEIMHPEATDVPSPGTSPEFRRKTMKRHFAWALALALMIAVEAAEISAVAVEAVRSAV